jgi:hypothetical protein
MNDERDPVLTRLFAEHRQPVQGSDFVAQFIDVMERDQRKRRTYRTGMIIAGVIVAALLAPWIAQVAATAIGSVAVSTAAAQSLLNFPMPWLVVCSIVPSFLPVIYLGITRRW